MQPGVRPVHGLDSQTHDQARRICAARGGSHSCQAMRTRAAAAPRGVRRRLYAAAMADDPFDPLQTPRCPIHPTERLVVVGAAPDGRDAHWRCPVPGCVYKQLA
jgi:hypothetical protein